MGDGFVGCEGVRVKAGTGWGEVCTSHMQVDLTALRTLTHTHTHYTWLNNPFVPPDHPPLCLCTPVQHHHHYHNNNSNIKQQTNTQAAAAAPSIIFLDELDGLVPARSTRWGGVWVCLCLWECTWLCVMHQERSVCLSVKTTSTAWHSMPQQTQRMYLTGLLLV